jgi:zinc transporter
MTATPLATPAYSSDRTGLVWAYRFAPGASGVQIDADEALTVAAHPDGARLDEFVWLHFDLTSAAAERTLRERLDLPEAFFAGLEEQSRSTQIEHSGDGLVAVVNDVLFDFRFEATQVSTLLVAVDRHRVVTARRKPLRSIDRLRTAVREGEGFDSPASLLVHLLRDQADVLVAIVRDATTRIDHIEDTFLAKRLDIRRADLGALRRVLVRLRRLLAPEPATLFRLLNRPPKWIAEDDRVALRQSTEEFAAVLNDVAALLERSKLLQEEIAAKVNEQSNRFLLLLSIVTVIGLPFTMIGGLFGMNVGGIPFGEHPRGFWIIVALVAIATGALVWLLLRMRRL